MQYNKNHSFENFKRHNDNIDELMETLVGTIIRFYDESGDAQFRMIVGYTNFDKDVLLHMVDAENAESLEQVYARVGADFGGVDFMSLSYYLLNGSYFSVVPHDQFETTVTPAPKPATVSATSPMSPKAIQTRARLQAAEAHRQARAMERAKAQAAAKVKAEEEAKREAYAKAAEKKAAEDRAAALKAIDGRQPQWSGSSGTTDSTLPSCFGEKTNSTPPSGSIANHCTSESKIAQPHVVNVHSDATTEDVLALLRAVFGKDSDVKINI